MGLARVVRNALDTFAPARCAACDEVSEDAICSACVVALREARLPAPRRTDGRLAVAAFEFAGPVRGVLHRGKFRGNRRALQALADLALPRVVSEPLARPAALVPVPLGLARRRERGYNQAAVIAERWAPRVGAPLVDALARVRETAPQADLDEVGRCANVAGAFSWRGPSLGGRRLWLVDDVMTTGATTDAAAAALSEAGAARVDAVVLALVP